MSKASKHSDPLELMQESLDQRDTLIEELTLRLERTVEELDRMRRTGKSGTSGGRGGGGGGSLPSELVEQQTELANRLEDAVEHWESAQPVEQLSRIEENIHQILSSLASGNTPQAISAVPVSKPKPAPEAPSKSSEDDKGDAEDFWAATKARLMGGDTPEPVASAPNPMPQATQSQSESQTEEATEPVAKQNSPSEDALADGVVNFIPDDDMPPAPEPIEELADNETLLDAVEQRDIYIKYLTSRLRDQQNRLVGRVDWESLNRNPDQLEDQLYKLQEMLEEQLKKAEIAISLERAAITRQKAKLFQVKRQLEKEILRIPATGAKSSGSDEEEASSRWGKLFSREK